MENQNTAYELSNSELIAGIQKNADRNLVTDFIPTSTKEIRELIEMWVVIKADSSTPTEIKPRIQDEINGYYALLMKKGILARDVFEVSADDFNLPARAQDIKDVEKTFPDVEKAKESYAEMEPLLIKQNKSDSKKSLVIVAKDGEDVEQFIPDNDNSKREEKVLVEAETELNEANTDEPITLRDIGIKFKELVAQDKKEMALSLIDSTLKVGHYIPKKTKQVARCWESEELKIWIKKMSKGTIILGKENSVEKVKVDDGPSSKIEDKLITYSTATAQDLDNLRDVVAPMFKSKDEKEIEKAHKIFELAFADTQYDDNLIREWTELVSSGSTEKDHLDILMPKAEEKFDTSDFDVWLVDAVKILSLEEIQEKREYKSIVKRAESFNPDWDADTHVLSFYDAIEKHPTNDEGEPAATVSEDAKNVSTEEQEIVAKETNQESTTYESEYISLKELKELIIKESKTLSIDEICSLGPVNKLINQSTASNSFAKHKHLRKYVANIYDTAKNSDNQKEEIVYPNNMNEVKLIGTKMILEDGYNLEGMVIWLKKFLDVIEVLNLPTDEKVEEFVKSFFKDSFEESLVKKHGPEQKEKLSIDEIKTKIKEFIEEGEKQPLGIYYCARTLFRKAGYNTDDMEIPKIKKLCNEIINDVDPKILEKYNQDKEDREEIRESKIIIDDKVFVKELLATSNPELWEEVKSITTLGELENKALELCEGEKWPEALNMSIDLITSNLIEDNKDMSQEDVVDWFSKTVLQAQSTENNVEEKELDEKYEGKDSDKWSTLKTAHNKNDYKHAVDDILLTFSDRQNLNKDIITAIKASTGKYVTKLSNRKDAELHKFINNRRNNLLNKQK